jgi:hypothetical protein
LVRGYWWTSYVPRYQVDLCENSGGTALGAAAGRHARQRQCRSQSHAAVACDTGPTCTSQYPIASRQESETREWRRGVVGGVRLATYVSYFSCGGTCGDPSSLSDAAQSQDGLHNVLSTSVPCLLAVPPIQPHTERASGVCPHVTFGVLLDRIA